jgi:ATP-binding cassette subfamily B protein
MKSIADGSPDLPNQPGKFALHFIKFYKWRLAAMFLLELGQSSCQIMIPYAIKKIIDANTLLALNPNESLFTQFKGPLTLFISLSIGILLFGRASGTLLVIVGPLLRRKIRGDLYHYLQYHSQRFFSSHFSGSLSNRISEVAMSVNHSTWTILFDFWPTCVVFSFSLYLLLSAHTGIGLFLGGWIIFYITISYLLARKCREYAKNAAAARSVVSGKIVDAVTNIMNTKLFTQLGFERKHLDGYLTHELQMTRKTFWFMEKMRWFQNISTLSLQVAMIFYGLSVWQKKEITIGEFSMITSLSLLIINDARNLSRRFLDFFEYIGNITDGVRIMIVSHDIVDETAAKSLAAPKGQIEFKNVTFGYTPAQNVFENFDLKILPGQKVGLVGFSGSGKSTFLNLILRFYEINSGQILIDGQNILNVTQDSLRSKVSVIPQEPMLFHRTLMENIRYGRIDATDDEVIRASKEAHAHEFIIDKPDQYKALVGERGIKLSGGQRQRIAIARAFLKNAPILLMDEATSSLDSHTEKLIQKSLQSLMENRTVIVIAHRLSTISQMDRIIVFHEGKVVEDGSHDQLIAKGSYYSKMWNMQAGGFLPSAVEDPIILRET